MSVRDNVRERRRERLKAIAENARITSASVEEPIMPGMAYREREGRAAVHAREDNDPEAAWRLREQELGWRWAVPGDQRNRNREERWKEWNAPPSRGQWRGKIALCGLLFAAVWGLFQLKQPWALASQQWIRHSMQQEFDYAAVKSWYEARFAGAPSFLPAFGRHEDASSDSLRVFVPAKGSAASYSAGGYEGVMVTTQPNAPLRAMTTGRVVFVGQRQDTGYTVIVQHASGMESIYGFVQDSTCKVNDWVKGGQTIGTVSPASAGASGRYFFALERGSKPLNPTDVMAFD